MIKPLSTTRKADREVMSVAVAVLARHFGATATLSNPEYAPKDIRIDIKAARGLCVAVEFRGKSTQSNVYVLSWNMHYNSIDQLNDATFGGQVNPYHKQKATYVAYGFVELCEKLSKGLTLAKSGEAFL